MATRPSAVNSRLVNSRCKRRYACGGGCAGGVSRPVVERRRRVTGWQSGRTATCGMWCASPSGRRFSRRYSLSYPRYSSPARSIGRFPGRLALLRLCAMTLILPVLVAVSAFLASMVARAGWHRSANRSVWSGPFRPTACKVFCWRTYFLICRWRAAYYSRHWKTFPANNVSCRPAWDARLAFFPLRRMAVVTATNPASCCAYLYALFASFATVLSLGGGPQANHYRAGYLSGAELRLRSCPRGDAGVDQMVCCLGLVLLSQRLK
ncbi:thiamine ABC transport system, permease protein [Escherichia coli]|uniref:Thiamine ABC transport system, permease protein n=1 Tax=Escherichia coli TaxID=562 RepID=A0A485JJG5_ECOLX|nr:thiamine ABC transport system, permease protein [Escherichia coli]